MGDINPRKEASPMKDALGRETDPKGTSLRVDTPPKTGTGPIETSPVIGISPIRTGLREENLPETDTSPPQDKEGILDTLLRTEIGLSPTFSPGAGTDRTQDLIGISPEIGPTLAPALSPIAGLRADLPPGAMQAPNIPQGIGLEDPSQGTGLAGPVPSI